MKFRSVILLVLSHTATDLNQGAIPVLLPFFMAVHHLNYATAATIVFATNIVSSFSQPLFGYAADRRPAPWVIPTAMLFAALGVSLTGIASNFRLGVAAFALSGLGFAAFHPEGAKLMNYLAGERKATAMSLFTIGGQLGFAIGPLIATVAMLEWGLKGTVCLGVPALVLSALLWRGLPAMSVGYVHRDSGQAAKTAREGQDLWSAFIFLGSALLCRSIIFFGLNTFLPLFWIDVLHQSKAAGGVALTVFFGAGIAGNFLGGRTADRFGYKIVVVVAFGLLTLLLPLLVLVRDVTLLTLLLAPMGLVLFAPVGPMVVLGQSYLPNRVGMASGVTLGLAFSFGGLTTPLLGWIGDHHGLRAALSIVAFLPIVCTGLALMLPGPKQTAHA